MVTIQSVSQEEKKFCVLYELGYKTQLGFWAHFEPLSGFTGGPGGEALKKFTIFCVKLVWYSLLEIKKTKIVL